MRSNNLRSHDKDQPEDTERFFAAKKRAATLGVALIVVAVLCMLCNLGALVAVGAIKRQNPPAQLPKNMAPGEKEQLERGRDAAPLFDFLGVGMASLVYLPVLLGGEGLLRGSGRVLGLVAAGMAMLPCSPGFLIGLPVVA